MTLLYPRLLRHRARELASEYRTLGPLDLATRWGTADDAAVYVATGGARVSPEKLQNLREILVDLAKESGFPEPPSADQRSNSTSNPRRCSTAKCGSRRPKPLRVTFGRSWP